MNVFSLTFLAAIFLAIQVPVSLAQDSTGPDRRDASNYALAVCLSEQETSSLRDQGFGLGAIVIERSGTPVAAFSPILEAVSMEMAKRPMTLIKTDGPVGEMQPLPLAYCLDVVEAPNVADAVAAVSKQPLP